jgi:NADPH2:quinone reductase
VLGVFWGSFIERDLAGHRANTEQIMRWCLDGKVSSHIHAVYPLAESAAALKAIADRKVMGKVILRM